MSLCSVGEIPQSIIEEYKNELLLSKVKYYSEARSTCTFQIEPRVCNPFSVSGRSDTGFVIFRPEFVSTTAALEKHYRGIRVITASQSETISPGGWYFKIIGPTVIATKQ